jgi:predicted nucleic acid-binding protein
MYCTGCCVAGRPLALLPLVAAVVVVVELLLAARRAVVRTRAEEEEDHDDDDDDAHETGAAHRRDTRRGSTADAMVERGIGAGVWWRAKWEK